MRNAPSRALELTKDKAKLPKDGTPGQLVTGVILRPTMDEKLTRMK
jgi:hypothetical protein